MLTFAKKIYFLLGGTTSTGTWAWCNTQSLVLPNKARDIVPRPLWPITIEEAFFSSANLQIACPGFLSTSTKKNLCFKPFWSHLSSYFFWSTERTKEKKSKNNNQSMQFNLPSFPRFTEVVQNRADRITQTQITTNQIYLKILLQPVIFAEFLK